MKLKNMAFAKFPMHFRGEHAPGAPKLSWLRHIQNFKTLSALPVDCAPYTRICRFHCLMGHKIGTNEVCTTLLERKASWENSCVKRAWQARGMGSKTWRVTQSTQGRRKFKVKMGATPSSCSVEETKVSFYRDAAVLREHVKDGMSLRLYRVTSNRFEAILHNPQRTGQACFSLFTLPEEEQAKQKFRYHLNQFDG